MGRNRIMNQGLDVSISKILLQSIPICCADYVQVPGMVL